MSEERSFAPPRPPAAGARLSGPPLWYYPALAIAATLFAHFVFVDLLPAAQRGNDSTDFASFYLPVAQNLAAGRGLTAPDGSLAVRYPPLFPAVLGAALYAGRLLGFPDTAIVRQVQILALALIALTLYRLAALVLASPGWGLLVAAAWAWYPPFLFAGKQPNSELLFLPLFFLAVELCWRSRDTSPRRAAGLMAAAGGAAGLAALCRPVAFALFLPLGLALLISEERSRPRRWRELALFAAALVLTLLPWHLALAEARGRFTLMSTGGRLSMLDGLTYAAKVPEPPPMPARALALARRIHDHRGQLKTPSEVLAYLAAEPDRIALAQLLAVKAARAWYATDSLRFEGFSLALQVPLLLAFAWASRVAWQAGGPSRAFAALAMSLTLYFWALAILVLSILRYLLPVLPLLLLVIALAIRRRAGGRIRLRENGRIL